MNWILSIIAFIFILSVIVIIHELGHLLTAKYFGVYCEEFAIGMGPTLYKRKGKETTFAIRALPIGGFVSMAGEQGVECENIPHERTINGIKAWQKIVVMAAGSFMNIMLAWALFIGVIMMQGRVSLPPEPIVANVVEGSPAAKAGFQANDRIVEVSSQSITLEPKNFNEISEHIQYYPVETNFKVERNGEVKNLTLTPEYIKDENRYYLGINLSPNIKEISFLESFQYGTQELVNGMKSIGTALSKLVQGIGLQNLSGPVGIFKITSDVAKTGFVSILSLIALLSLNIGIFNLLPLPVLDGGRIFITLIEKVSGRTLSGKAEGILMGAGVLFLIGIMVLATWQDIVRLF